MQASRRITPNTKCVTPARWGNRGAEHGAEKRERFTDAASMRRHWKSTEGSTMTEAAATQTKCTYCGKPAEKVVRRSIHDRTRDPYTNRQVLRTRELPFCSAEHASNYQMGCEG